MRDHAKYLQVDFGSSERRACEVLAFGWSTCTCPLGGGRPGAEALIRDERWAMDPTSNELFDGRRIRVLTIVFYFSSKGVFGLLPSSIISLNWGRLATRPLSATSTYSRATA